MATALRSLILCGCIKDTPTRCTFSFAGKGCKCPCHYTQDQTQRLITAYFIVDDGQISGFVKNQAQAKKSSSVSVSYSCGHEFVFDQRPSAMGLQYIHQNQCENCRSQNG